MYVDNRDSGPGGKGTPPPPRPEDYRKNLADKEANSDPNDGNKSESSLKERFMGDATKDDVKSAAKSGAGKGAKSTLETEAYSHLGPLGHGYNKYRKGKRYIGYAKNAGKVAKGMGKAAKAGETAAEVGAAAGAAAPTAGASLAVAAAKEAGSLAAKKTVKKGIKMVKGDFAPSKWTVFVTLGLVGIATMAMAFFMFLPSFTISTLTSRVTDAFMDRVNFTTKTRSVKYIASYVKDVLHPNLEGCGQVVDTDCDVSGEGEGRRAILYDAWKRGKIEERLRARHGIEFAPSTTGQPEDIQVFKHSRELGSMAEYVNTGEALRDIQDVTEAKGVQDRAQVRHNINNRFANKWCLLLCDDEDAIGESDDVGVLDKIKLKISSRILSGTAARFGALFTCPVNDCTPDFLEDAARIAAQRALSTVDSEFLSVMVDEFQDNVKDFLTGRVVWDLAKKLGLASGLQAAFDSIDIPGWRTFTSYVSDYIDLIQERLENNELPEFNAEVNKAEYAVASSSIHTLDDEVQDNDTTIFEDAASFQLLIGFGSSRVYQAVNNISPKSTVECADGTILEGEDDPLICPDKRVVQEVDVEEVASNPFFNFFRNVGSFIGGILGALIPGFDFVVTTLESWITATLSSMNWTIDNATPRVYNNQPDEGSEPTDNLGGGIDVIANSVNMGVEDIDGDIVGLGAAVCEPEDEIALARAIHVDEENEMRSKSLFARYLDIADPYSLVSSTTMAFASTIPAGKPLHLSLDPLRILGSVMTFFTGSASAQTTLNGLDFNRESVYGNVQFCHTLEDIGTPIEALDDGGFCEERHEAWEDSRDRDENGQTIYTEADICKADDWTIYQLTAFANLGTEEEQNAYWSRLIEDPFGTGGAGVGTGASGPIVGGFVWPLQQTEAEARSSVPFNDATRTIGLGGHPYPAHDLIAPTGTVVVAATSGEIIRADVGNAGCANGGRAWRVQIYNDGATYFYQHMDPNFQPVSLGPIAAGQVIGRLGGSPNTHCSVPHLHIDASRARGRGACSRRSCPIRSLFLNIAGKLYEAGDALGDVGGGIGGRQ